MKALNDPARREELLREILPEQASQHSELLRILFQHEVVYREKDDQWEYFENLYWCGFLLFHVGDVKDAEMMWEAKHINQDTGVGFDIQTLVGGSVDATIEHLEGRGRHDIADRLRKELESGTFDNLGEWATAKRHYYYSA